MLKNISKAEFESLIQGGKVLEVDWETFKVVMLPNQRILKLFRRKRLISSQIWSKHASRFKSNAEKLKHRGFVTIDVESVFNIPEIQRQGVLYKMLEGDTLRDWLAANDPADSEAKIEKIEKFGTFVAELHLKGILFRSLHLGNVLVMPDGEIGIIDIADMSFRSKGALTTKQRIRNFHHMDRVDEDRRYLASSAGTKFMARYIEAAKLPDAVNQQLISAFDSIFTKYRENHDV